MSRALTSAFTLICSGTVAVAACVWLMGSPNADAQTVGIRLLGFAIFPILPLGMVAVLCLGIHDIRQQFVRRRTGEAASEIAAGAAFALLWLTSVAGWLFLAAVLLALYRV